MLPPVIKMTFPVREGMDVEGLKVERIVCIRVVFDSFVLCILSDIIGSRNVYSYTQKQ